ncbi:MAG: ion transporter [Candidatus Hydrogenedentes bacterium]|nr:ion transporter [Candidatus Hydrogenedentota bacterium]
MSNAIQQKEKGACNDIVEGEEHLGIWQYFMFLLSIITLAMLAVQTFGKVAEDLSSILQFSDNIICIFFFADFLWQLSRSRPMSAYLKWGWLDLLSSIPMLPAFRIARVVRIVRILRVLRAARASKHLFKFILIHRARSTFGAVVFGSFILLLFAVMAIVTIEPTMNANDAFWWCLFTLITGEYGDYYPASTEGRIITTLLMTAGVALFGTFTASVASFFLEGEQEEDEKRDIDILHEVSQLKQQVSELRKEIKEEKYNG